MGTQRNHPLEPNGVPSPYQFDEPLLGIGLLCLSRFAGVIGATTQTCGHPVRAGSQPPRCWGINHGSSVLLMGDNASSHPSIYGG